MSNELDTLSAGELQPYNEGASVLAPHNHDSWAQNTDVDLLNEHQHAPRQVTLFGAPLPPGTTEQQVQTMLHNMSVHYGADFQALGYPADLVSSTVTFYKENALKPPQHVRRQHSFKLPDAFNGDWLAESYGNYLQGLAGTKQQKQQLLTESIRWLAKLVKQLSQTLTEGSGPAHGSAPNTSEAVLNRLSEVDYNKVVAINEKAKQQTMGTLAAKHGQYTAQQMLVLAQEYLNQLPIADQNHFDQFTTVNGQSFVHMMNTVDAIEFLHGASIGSASLPTSGADIAKEIAQFEAMLKVPAERAKYMRDPQMQARLRELYSRRG